MQKELIRHQDKQNGQKYLWKIDFNPQTDLSPQIFSINNGIWLIPLFPYFSIMVQNNGICPLFMFRYLDLPLYSENS